MTALPTAVTAFGVACALAFPCATSTFAQTQSDAAREKRWAEQIVPSLVVGAAAWLTRKFSPTGIDGGLKDGDPLRGDLFPALWPRGDSGAAPGPA